MPTISVIMPVYKVEQYLSRAVDSVLAQSYTDFELILVDDGSPDRSGVICDEYATQDSRIRVIHKENGGLSDARNAGIEASYGKYLFFMDSDDVIHKECLALLIKSAIINNAQIVSGAFSRFEGAYPKEESMRLSDDEYECVNNREALDKIYDDQFSFQRAVSVCCKLFWKSLFYDIRFPKGKLFEDEHIIHELYYKAQSIVFLKQVLYYYFINSGGITKNIDVAKALDEHDAQWKRILFFKEKQLEQLCDKAVMVFLKNSKWDLIACRGNEGRQIDKETTRIFEKRFLMAFKMAKKRRLLEFIRDFDYYMLAKPSLGLWWKIKKKVIYRR